MDTWIYVEHGNERSSCEVWHLQQYDCTGFIPATVKTVSSTGCSQAIIRTLEETFPKESASRFSDVKYGSYSSKVVPKKLKKLQ